MKTKVGGRSLVFEEGDVFTAQKYLRNLADGRGPLGGEDLTEYPPLREPALVRALSLSADLLEAWLSNGGFNRVEPNRIRAFELSDSDRSKIKVTEDAVGVMTVANRISKVVPYDMQTVRYGQICAWLQYLGALEWTGETGHKRRVSTPVGHQLGIRTVDRRAADGTTYQKNVYDSNAQRFIIDNLEGILSYSAQQNVRKAAEKVEKARVELEALEKEAALAALEEEKLEREELLTETPMKEEG